MGISLLVNTLFIVILTLVALFYDWRIGIVTPFFLYGIGWVSVHYHEYILNVLNKMRFAKIAKKNSREIMKLLVMRKKLIAFLEN